MSAADGIIVLIGVCGKMTRGMDIVIGKRVQFSSVAQSCPTLCGSMNHSMPGLPVHHKLPGFTQTHVQ